MSTVSNQKLNSWLSNLNQIHFREIVATYLAQSEPERRQFLAEIAVFDDNDNFFDKLADQFKSIIGRQDKPPYYKLAETLLLFTETLENAAKSDDNEKMKAAIRHANQHYIINTNGRIPLMPHDEDSNNFDVFKWATEYASTLSIVLEQDPKNPTTYMIIEDPKDPYICDEWGNTEGNSPELTLRNVARLINDTRYDRQDIMPTHLFPFDPHATRHEKYNAMWMAQFSSIVYKTSWYTAKEMERLGFDNEEPRWIENLEDKKHDTQAFVATDGVCIVVAFRGTDKLTDWMTNFDFIEKDKFSIADDNLGNVHGGFFEALDSVWGKILSAIDDLGADKPIFITGHSLGGALAQLAAIRLINSHNVAAVYTFGAPRVGGEKFAEFYEEQLGDKVFLHVNSQDGIPHLPPWSFGYRHVSEHIRRFDAGHKLMLDGANSAFHQELDDKQLEVNRKRAEETAKAQSKAKNKDKDLKNKQAESNSYATVDKISAGVIRLVSDHSPSDYLYKLACAIMEKKLDAMDW